MDFRTCEEGKELRARPLHTERQSDCGQLFDAVQPQLDKKYTRALKQAFTTVRKFTENS